jgi:hypothetical protein
MSTEFDSQFEEEKEEEAEAKETAGEEFIAGDPAADEQAYDVDTADLLKLYLREASRAPMLDAAGEVQAARRIERARNRMKKLLSRSPLAAEYCLYVRQALRAREESAGDIIERIDGGSLASSLTSAALSCMRPASS